LKRYDFKQRDRHSKEDESIQIKRYDFKQRDRHSNKEVSIQTKRQDIKKQDIFINRRQRNAYIGRSRADYG